MDIVITGANGAVGTATIRYLSAGSRWARRACEPVPASRAQSCLRSAPRSSSSITASRDVTGCGRGQRWPSIWLAPCCPDAGETLVHNVEATQALIEAAAAAGVKTCVYLSFPGADPVSKNQYLGSKGMAEAIIQQAGFAGAICGSR